MDFLKAFLVMATFLSVFITVAIVPAIFFGPLGAVASIILIISFCFAVNMT